MPQVGRGALLGAPFRPVTWLRGGLRTSHLLHQLQLPGWTTGKTESMPLNIPAIPATAVTATYTQEPTSSTADGVSVPCAV